MKYNSSNKKRKKQDHNLRHKYVRINLGKDQEQRPGLSNPSLRKIVREYGLNLLSLSDQEVGLRSQTPKLQKAQENHQKEDLQYKILLSMKLMILLVVFISVRLLKLIKKMMSWKMRKTSSLVLKIVLKFNNRCRYSNIT